MVRKIAKGIAIFFGLIGIFFLILFIAMSIFNSPTYAWRILRYGRSDIGDYDIFTERTILNGPTVSVTERGKAIHFP